MSQIKVNLKRRTIGCIKKQKATIEALGLKKIGSSRVHNDTKEIRGMINVVSHLVEVVEL